MAATELLHFTGNDEADRLLVDEPLALLVGFVLDQQVPVQKAFSGPLELTRRLGKLDARAIAAMDPAVLEDIFCTKPAIHRYPGSMARRTHDLCSIIVSDYGGNAASVWTEARTGEELAQRLRALPGFGEMKVRTIASVLGKQLGVRPPGWESVATPSPCLGDVGSYEQLAEYQSEKRARKAAARRSQLNS